LTEYQFGISGYLYWLTRFPFAKRSNTKNGTSENKID
jgi:hypothetical protein